MARAMVKRGGTPAVELRGLTRAYGERVALRDVSLSLAAGESLSVLGPNGAGKTTLLRVLATLLRPNGGEATVLGCSLPGDAWRLRGRIGYLGHDPLLYRELSGRENLRFQARLYGLDEDRAERRIERLLEAVGMGRRAGEQVRDLSAGMVRRLDVCRAVLHEPDLLLLDEPHAHLDPEGRDLVEPLIGPARGRTRIVVTHEARDGMPRRGRALALDHGGAVAYEGPASRLSKRRLSAIYGGEIR
jgi:ABC-type multidrug transport system ATPase subunit